MPDEPPCIFCFKNTDFTRGHVIADAIGGSLVLDGFVCKDCNSRLGAYVDSELVKLPETIDAFEVLGIPYDRDKMLNRHWKAVGSARDIEVSGRLTGDEFHFHPQVLSDDSMLMPKEKGVWSALRKSALREAVGTEKEIDDELSRLQTTYEALAPDGLIRSELLGRTLVKRSDVFDVKLTPRNETNLTPVMAKIAYEFLFLIAGARGLFVQENAEAVNMLMGLISGKPVDDIERCIRLAPPSEGFDDAHGISFERGQASCIFRIILFGNVHFLLVTPFLSESVLDAAKAAAKQDVKGVQYLQRVTTGTMNFLAIAPDDKTIRLPVE